MYSDKCRKLIFSLIEDYSKSVYNSKSRYYLSESEKVLKKEYAKVSLSTSDKDANEPFKDLRYKLSTRVQNELKNKIVLSDDILDIIEDYTIKEVQKLYRLLNFGFSLKRHLFTQEMANNFIDWLLGYFIENDIEMKKEILEVLDISQREKLTFACLMNCKCCVTGKHTKTLHHVKSVGYVGGYKKDKGVGQLIIPVAPEIHAAIHEKGMFYTDIVREYGVYPIKITENMVKELQNKYGKHYFMAFEEE